MIICLLELENFLSRNRERQRGKWLLLSLESSYGKVSHKVLLRKMQEERGRLGSVRTQTTNSLSDSV